VPLLGDIPYLGALFRYETRNRKRTNLMIFLRPVVLKDERAAASLTADRYEYIRGEQGGVKLPPSVIMPQGTFAPMPPLEEQQGKPLRTQ
jgi:general secretion pathway protein D